MLRLSGACPYVISGTNLNGAVRIDVEGDAAVTASNLRIKTSSAKEHCALLLNLSAAVEIDRRERDGRFQLLYLG